MSVAVETLREALAWVPPDVQLGLRVYGHQDDRQLHNCRDTERLVQPGIGNRDQIRSAIATLEPRGQTPIAYALQQAALDLGSLSGERAVVLLTDGNESCDGDAPAAARALQELGPIPVHVIGFGMESAETEKHERLKEIARVSGGLFLTASDAVRLRDALRSVVGTRYRVLRDGRTVATGTLGGDAAFALPAGQYEVRLDGQPGVSVPIEVMGERNRRLTFDVLRGEHSHSIEETNIERFSCDLPTLPVGEPTEPE
jgi:Ca-activated chloride channel family protein